jgi:hypothetical protein
MLRTRSSTNGTVLLAREAEEQSVSAGRPALVATRCEVPRPVSLASRRRRARGSRAIAFALSAPPIAPLHWRLSRRLAGRQGRTTALHTNAIVSSTRQRTTPLATEQVYLVRESSLGRRVGPTARVPAAQTTRQAAGVARGWRGRPDEPGDTTGTQRRPLDRLSRTCRACPARARTPASASP